MNSDIAIAVLAGLGGMLGWGLADFFAKKTIDEIGDIVTLVWAHLFGAIGLGSFVVFMAITHSTSLILDSTAAWAGLVGFGILQGIVYLLVYRGFGKGQVAVLNPVFASYSGLAAAISLVIFGESLGGLVVGLLAVIFAGILLLSLDINELKARKIKLNKTPGLSEMLLAAVLAAIWTVLWSRFVGGKDPLLYAFWMYVFMALTVYALAKLDNVSLRFTQSSAWKFLILIGFCEAGVYVSISAGFSLTGHTSIVALLSGASSLVTVVLARIFLGEQISRVQGFGVAAIIAGVAAITLVR